MRYLKISSKLCPVVNYGAMVTFVSFAEYVDYPVYYRTVNSLDTDGKLRGQIDTCYSVFKTLLRPQGRGIKVVRSRRASFDEKHVQQMLRESSVGRNLVMNKQSMSKKSSRLFERRKSTDDFELGRRSPPSTRSPDLPSIRPDSQEANPNPANLSTTRTNSFRVGGRLLAPVPLKKPAKLQALAGRNLPTTSGIVSPQNSLIATLRRLDSDNKRSTIS